MWGDRIKIAREQGMEALVESTLARWFTEPYRKARKDVMKRIGDDIRNTPVNGFIGCCHAISRLDYLDRLKEIKVPVLIMVGEQDHGTPPEAARVIQQNLAAIDQAIGQAQRALAADPANLYLNTHLAETMRRKLDLLRQAATLVHAS